MDLDDYHAEGMGESGSLGKGMMFCVGWRGGRVAECGGLLNLNSPL